MKFRFKDRKLYRLYTEEYGAKRYPPAVVDAFFEVMEVIASAVSEQDLYNLKGLRYEKLKGARAEEHSLRLSRQYRLIVRWEEETGERWLIILSIEDYH